MKFFVVSDCKHIYKQDRQGKLVKLEELNRSEYLILLYLYENKSDIVSRNSLIEKGWPGRIVSENSLNVAMMKLRRKLSTLNEFARVETFLGEGYRLIASEDFSLELVPSIAQITEDEGNIDEPIQPKVYQRKNTRDRLSWLVINGAYKVKSAFSITSSYLSNHPRLQLLLGLLLCLFTFVYLYSEGWSTFICTKETVCSDYLG